MKRIKTLKHRERRKLLRAGGVPHDADDPPAGTVIEQLDTVRAAFERQSVRTAERLIEAEYVCEMADGFSLAARFPLPEIFDGEDRLDTANVIFGAQETHS